MIYSCTHALRNITAYIDTKRYLKPRNYGYLIMARKGIDEELLLYDNHGKCMYTANHEQPK